MKTDTGEPQFADEHELLVQREGIEAGPIMAFIISLVTLLVALVWGATLWFRASVDEVHQKVAASAVYPELQRVNIASQERTEHYAALGDGWYQIPLERAIDLLASEYVDDHSLTNEIQLRPAD